MERCLAKQNSRYAPAGARSGRRGLLTVARLADYAWKALVTLALGAEPFVTCNNSISN
jgi:hypothetical protein